MSDQHPLRPDRLYYALVWWLFWNRESRLSLAWLLRFHRRPHAWAKRKRGNTMKRIWNDWDEYTLEEIAESFGATWPEGAELLFADYTYEDYSGNAFVLYRLDGKLYGVYGSHCSCYGLEGQWEPEEEVLEELIDRSDKHINGERHEWDNPITEADRALLDILLRVREESAS